MLWQPPPSKPIRPSDVYRGDTGEVSTVGGRMRFAFKEYRCVSFRPPALGEKYIEADGYITHCNTTFRTDPRFIMEAIIPPPPFDSCWE